MKIHNVAQGSAEWHALRAQHFTASEAPAMMGASKYQTRTDLLTMKKTGIAPEVNQAQQYIFDRGHATEALARPLVEVMIGEELYPVVGTDGNLLASMDGATMLGETLFEHKLWNESLVAQVKAGELDPHYYWQLEQQLLVSGAERVIFVCSDGTAENFVHMEYRSVAGRAAQLVEGWSYSYHYQKRERRDRACNERISGNPASTPSTCHQDPASSGRRRYSARQFMRHCCVASTEGAFE